MRISDWSSDVCSSDLRTGRTREDAHGGIASVRAEPGKKHPLRPPAAARTIHVPLAERVHATLGMISSATQCSRRSEEHTSELQSLMRISYAVFCLKNKHEPERQQTRTTTLNTHAYPLH